MKSDNANSESTSATTSKGEPKSSAPPPDATPAELSEAEYLTQQANEAKAALQAAFHDAVHRLGEGVNPTQWAKDFPWMTVGASAVAGFVAATFLVPSKEQQALAKLAAIERALNPPPPRESKRDEESNGHGDGRVAGAATGFLGMIAREAIGAVKPAIISLLTAGVTAKAAKPSQAEMEAAARSEDVKEEQGLE